MARRTAPETPVQRIARVAGTVDTDELPQPLRQPAEEFLTAHAERLPASLREGYNEMPAASIAWEVGQDVEFALFLIACFDAVPPISAAGDENAMLDAFDLGSNVAVKAALVDAAHPLTLPFILWNLLREREIRLGDHTTDQAADWFAPLAARWCVMGRRPTLPQAFTDWLLSEGGDHYRNWRARRAQQRKAG